MTLPDWIGSWQTAARFQKYVTAAGGNHERALDLYTWNARLAAAFLHDTGHLEVGLRNAYDRALLAHPNLLYTDWLTERGADLLFPPHMVKGRGGRPWDKNKTPRKKVRDARQIARMPRGAPRGKAIAELSFGFWTYLTDDLHEKTLWVPVLHTAYTTGTNRSQVHAALSDLRDLRNRVAHQESVFDRDPERHRRRILYVSGLLSSELRRYIASTSELSKVIKRKP